MPPRRFFRVVSPLIGGVAAGLGGIIWIGSSRHQLLGQVLLVFGSVWTMVTSVGAAASQLTSSE